MSALELSLTDVMDKLVVDDWGQAHAGKLGALRPHVEAGKLSEETLHAELCQIAVGDKPGRERDDETREKRVHSSRTNARNALRAPWNMQSPSPSSTA